MRVRPQVVKTLITTKMKSKFYRISRTVSYFNEDSEDIITDFLREYKTINNSAIVEVLEENHISGLIVEYLNFNSIEDLKEHIKSSDDFDFGQCWTITDEDNTATFTEEYNIDDIGECSVCKKILLPDDEAYSDENTGEPLCDSHSRQNEETGNYYKSREQKNKADRKAFVFLAKIGCVLSTDEDGEIEIQRIDNPEDFAEENDLKFIPERLKSDEEAKAVYNSLTHNQMLRNNLI